MYSRKHIRKTSDMPFFFVTNVMMGHHICYLKDIGRGGLCFISRGYLKPETQLQVNIPVAEKTLSVIGKVSWCHSDNNGIYHLGVEFEMHQKKVLDSIYEIDQHKKTNMKNHDNNVSNIDIIDTIWKKIHEQDGSKKNILSHAS